ncbi:amidohydrolase family protein [Dactylosporangium sp. NPDC049140]|jgi:predicted TIM-barrel fold metal-dependent hydrolase|uniref:amidohydrolase family protein n=1 Tax=Dactylosporangium sp. NPDC049140 TaxID=3155647 RepID=UPI0033F25D46
MIVDAHTHVWPRWPYRPDVPDSDSRGRAENLLLEMDRAGVDAALVVNARIEHADDNNDYGAEAATVHKGRLLQVADIDSRFGPHYHRPGAADRLRATIERYQPVGVSHYLAAENDGWLRSDAAREFFQVAQDARLLVSLAAPPAWYDDLRDTARRFPDVPILVNHLAVVMLHPDGIDAGLRLVLDREEVPNLLVKVSGYYYGHDRPWDYPYDDRMPIVKAFAESWGPGRMVWSSDWPSLLPHHSYRQALQVLRDHAEFLSEDDIARIQGGTLETLLRERGRLQ